MNSVLVVAFVAVIAFCGGLSAPACVCDTRECEIVNEVDCPGLGVVVWDPCNLPYLECVVLETLRMFTGRVFTVPHRALKDTYLNGYLIPKDTQVIANLHGTMMRSESGFENPETFIPERFLKDGKITLPENYMPFAMGKHRCMGETLARANVFLFLCTMLQNFNFSIVPESPPDMQMFDGVTPAMKHFKARVVPRS